MVAEQNILSLIGTKFFSQPNAFIEAYTMGKNTVSQTVLRSHSDIVLKAPAEPEPGKYLLTIELR